LKYIIYKKATGIVPERRTHILETIGKEVATKQYISIWGKGFGAYTSTETLDCMYYLLSIL
jgi:hypothetical protein